jgi:phenylpyruvate tautomerase PptA (4-oxalocrotonate tautomerase family)
VPICLIGAPTGIRNDAKRKMVEKITAALDETWHTPDVRIFLREYPVENVAQDGRLQSEPVRPVCFINAPLLRSIDAKRRLAEKTHAALAEAYEGIANTRDIMLFIHQYELENGGWTGSLQSDKPEIVGAMKQLNGVGV